MEVCITKEELRKALADLDAVAENGLTASTAVFTLISAGRNLEKCVMVYEDIIAKAHPTDPHLNWGRLGKSCVKTYRVVEGQLVPIDDHSL